MNTSSTKTLTNNPGQPYVLNSTDSVIPVNVAPKGNEPVWLYVKLRRPRREELIAREAAATTTIKPKGGGESLIVSNDWEPNVKLGRAIALAVKGLTSDDAFVEADVKRLEPGWLNQAVKGYYAQASKLRFDKSLLTGDPNILFTVDHEFGTQELPDYAVAWQFRRPDEVTQADYRINSQKISTGGGGRRASSKFITDLTVAERCFDEIFASVEGGVIAVPKAEGEGFDLLVYEESRREEFLAAIDPVVKRDAVTPVFEYLEGQLSD